MKNEEIYLNLLNDSKLDELREILENNLLSKDTYVSSLKNYLKDLINNRQMYGYFEIDDNYYVCDGNSIFKVNDIKKCKKILNKLDNLKVIKEMINIDISLEENNTFVIENIVKYYNNVKDCDTVEIFGEIIECKHDKDEKFEKVLINPKYLNFIIKLCNIKNVKIYRQNNTWKSTIYVLNEEDNNILAVILPVIPN